MEIRSLINDFFQDSKRILSSEDVEIANDFFVHTEFHILVEFVCDQIIDNLIAVPKEFGDKTQALVEAMGLDPERTWRSLKVFADDPQEYQRLTTRKDFSELFQQTNEIYREIKERLTVADMNEINEFLSHDEYELALDVICAALVEEKIPISRQLLKKIKETKGKRLESFLNLTIGVS